MGEAAESRLTQLHEGTPGLAWWRDRAVRRKSISGASATGPVSRRATSTPSHRADDPPGPQAPGKQARLVHTNRTDRSGRGARMRCPSASVLCLSPPLVALLPARLAVRSGQSHPGLYTQPHQPGSGRRVTALARSDHSAATEEPAPSETLSLRRRCMSSCGAETHLFFSGHSEIDASDTSAREGSNASHRPN